MRASSGRFQYVRGGKIENNLVAGGNGPQDSVMFSKQPMTKNSVITGKNGTSNSLFDNGSGSADPITFSTQPKMESSYLTGGKVNEN